MSLKFQNHKHLEGLKDLEKDAERKGYAAIEGEKTFHRYVDGLFTFFQRNLEWGLAIRFRVFYMACSELFGMDGGEQ